MKKIFSIALIFGFISSVAMCAGIADSYTGVAKTTVESVKTIIVKDDKPESRCPVYPSTPYEDIERAPFELEFRFNVLDNPGDGSYQFHTFENIDLLMTVLT